MKQGSLLSLSRELQEGLTQISWTPAWKSYHCCRNFELFN